jgi:hypothetical protein
LEEGFDLSRQFERARGRHDAARCAHEQFIAERFTQPFERPAHRRLAEEEPLRGARDAALLQQRAKGQQQVQVEMPEIILNDMRLTRILSLWRALQRAM